VVKKAKYSSGLTEEDHKVINHIILMFAICFSMLLTKYHSPKELANYWNKKISIQSQHLPIFLCFLMQKANPLSSN
jgi:hypothetical protein